MSEFDLPDREKIKNCDSIESLIPEDLDETDTFKLVTKLQLRELKSNFKEHDSLLEEFSRNREKIENLEDRMGNGGVEELLDLQRELIEKNKEQIKSNTELVESWETVSQLGEKFLVPIIRVVGAGVLLYLAKLWFASNLF